MMATLMATLMARPAGEQGATAPGGALSQWASQPSRAGPDLAEDRRRTRLQAYHLQLVPDSSRAVAAALLVDVRLLLFCSPEGEQSAREADFVAVVRGGGGGWHC